MGVMQVLFYCLSLVVIKSVLIKPVLLNFLEIKRSVMVWIGFISICCLKVAKEGKSCHRWQVLQKVAKNAKCCSKVAEHNLFMPTAGSKNIASTAHATWAIDGNSNAFHYFRIFQKGKNSSEKFGIFISGIEPYGVLITKGS